MRVNAETKVRLKLELQEVLSSPSFRKQVVDWIDDDWCSPWWLLESTIEAIRPTLQLYLPGLEMSLKCQGDSNASIFIETRFSIYDCPLVWKEDCVCSTQCDWRADMQEIPTRKSIGAEQLVDLVLQNVEGVLLK
jgi:hypothetical protein